MHRFFSIELKEHRFCVKIIRHFYWVIYSHGNILEDHDDIGPITKYDFIKLKEIIYFDENKEEYNFGHNEIPEFYFLFFKYVMDISKNNMFKLKSNIIDKYILFEILLPDYNYSITHNKNLCKNRWEALKLITDEYELSMLIENINTRDVFLEKRKSIPNEYHENRKKIKIIGKKIGDITSNFENFNI
jgi:hypothetical protein